MSVLQILFMGLIQGVTEFLPVSSSGHLAIFQSIFNVETDTGILYDVMLHVGTLAAICVAFRSDIFRLIAECLKMVKDVWGNTKIYFHNKTAVDARRYKKIIHNNYRKLVFLIIISTIPTAVIGLLLEDLVAQASSNSLAPGVGLLLTGVMLLVIDYVQAGSMIPKDVPYRDAVMIGIAQGLAVFPGVSRSGMTIVACLLCGFNRRFAVKYSFLMSVPAVAGAAILELKDIPGSGVTGGLFAVYLLGTAIAGIVGYFCIKTMLVLVQKKKFRMFAVYCFFMGSIAIGCYYIL
ncbi:MAG: undecaprenyl-diphosphate phosphatase [Lachnospiraceae bacterium]|jgi:undecaprenyl-diphosphatase